MVDTFTTYTSNGQFIFFKDTGTYVTKVVPFAPYYTVNPVAHTSNFATYGNSDTVSFAVQSIPGQHDLRIGIIPLNVARPGFSVKYKILSINQGTDTASGTIQIVKSSKLNFYASSPSPSAINGDTLRWTYTGLNPGDTTGIVLYMLVKTPPVVSLGDTIRLTANIASTVADLTPVDNTFILAQRVLGSYDPNDKTESHGGKITTAQIGNSEYLQYTIRFQNTGTDTAFNVIIKDTLSEKLDGNSLIMIGSSHNFQMTVNDGKNCSWEFNDINLVDSNRNEPLSHGYLVFLIKAKTALTIGDTIKNRAAIYFDANLPVFTNTESTIVTSELLPVQLLSFTAKKEGTGNLLSWSTTQETNFSNFVIERSLNGREFSPIGSVRAGQSNYNFQDKTPVKGINYYRLKMMDKDGKYAYSTVRSINNSRIFSVNVYPNPATNILQLQLDSEKKSDIQLQVVGMDGKLLQTQKLSITEGSSLRTLSINKIPKGHYSLNITTSAKEQWSIKFEKL